VDVDELRNRVLELRDRPDERRDRVLELRDRPDERRDRVLELRDRPDERREHARDRAAPIAVYFDASLDTCDGAHRHLIRAAISSG
jgi:hypothetical protein